MGFANEAGHGNPQNSGVCCEKLISFLRSTPGPFMPATIIHSQPDTRPMLVMPLDLPEIKKTKTKKLWSWAEGYEGTRKLATWKC